MAKQKILTVNDVKEAVKGIKEEAKAGDFEAAHGSEICLYKEVLKQIVKEAEIATDHPNTQLDITYHLAKEALKASKIKFTRVTA